MSRRDAGRYGDWSEVTTKRAMNKQKTSKFPRKVIFPVKAKITAIM